MSATRSSQATAPKSRTTSNNIGFGGEDWIGDFADAPSGVAGPSDPSPWHAPAPDFGMVAASVVTVVSTTTTTTSTTAKTTTTATTTTATTYPSWMSTIKTAAIATDLKAAVTNGALTVTGMGKLFANLAGSLTSSRTTLTSTQLTDLKTIAANLTNGVTASSYLSFIVNALVNGSTANAKWTGGAANAVALGNLATGSTATQVGELVGKWFLGTDLPSSAVYMSGTAFSVTYSTVSKALFASTGPSMNDINQGYLGDCYLLASLAEVAKQNVNAIKSMFVDNGNGTYGVRFFENGVANWVTVNSSLAYGGTIFNSASADMWAGLAEKGYAQLQASGVVTGNTVNYGNSWSTIGNGGLPEYALEEITGASKITDFYAYRGTWLGYTYNSSLKTTGYASGLSTSSILSSLVSSLSRGDDVVLSSFTNAKDASGKTTLVAGHAMSIYGYNTATGLLQVRNPWGTMAGQTWATTFEVSLSTLLSAGDVITVDNMGGTTTTTATTTTTTTTTTVKAVASVFDDASATCLASSADGGVAPLDCASAVFAQAMATFQASGTANLASLTGMAAANQPVPSLLTPLAA